MTGRVLILGGTGMLGHALVEACQGRFETWCTVRSSLESHVGAEGFDAARTIDHVDAERFETVSAAVRRTRPETVVNAIGLVKRAAAGSDALANIAVNALFPHQLARCCAAAGARLIHISTDCVFSGRRGMYREDDIADADDLYGRSKRLGEVEEAHVLTLRTSFIGRELSTRRGLLEWCLSQRGGRVRGYTHAFFTGLSTLVLADLVAVLADRRSGLAGVYHVGGDRIDKCHLLALIRDAFRLDLDIEPAATPAVDRSLDSSRFRAITGFCPPDWPTMVGELASRPSRFVAPGGAAM